MEIVADTLDDVLWALYPALLSSTSKVPSSRGDTLELTGVSIRLQKPRARLSRTSSRGKPYSCLGELLWYLTRDNSLDFIRYYISRYKNESEDGETVYGGYGPRLFNMRGVNQIDAVIELLKRKSSSRRAAIQLLNAEDVDEKHKEIPCTTTMQFMVRDGLLNMVTTMRSNDAFMGLPHDVFCFTMMQEIIARAIECEVGEYFHYVGSMHLYLSDCEGAKSYLAEGIQSRIEMPPMPAGDPWGPIGRILEVEGAIRRHEEVDTANWPDGGYWGDLVRLLQIFAASGCEERIEQIKSTMEFDRFGVYIDPRKGSTVRKPFIDRVLKFDFR